ncbi:hypothetical protein NQ317_011399 [Molorchus minor]|uniref:Uncharacterized protein n=1 Tax=Molorchus minor TaxID=1323400 RepID=A0ABQ9IXT6_9CUCU|nr:hypothetical protein NQ317_011399 [Molorchus minor]
MKNNPQMYSVRSVT